jgi:DNA-binding transcriptional LysR family regulator
MVDANEEDVGIGLDTLGIAPFQSLVRVNIEGIPDDFHTIYLIYKKRSYKIPAVQHFIDLAKTFEWDDPRKG